MIQIHEEIDIIIKQANRYITYLNQSGTYGEFAHDFLRFANKSKLNQNFRFIEQWLESNVATDGDCLLYTSPSPRDRQKSRMPSSA